MEGERVHIDCLAQSQSRGHGGQSVRGLPSPPARPHVPCQAPPGPPTSLYKVTPLNRAKREPPTGRGHGGPSSRAQAPLCGVRQASAGWQREPLIRRRQQASEGAVRGSEVLDSVSEGAPSSEQSVCERDCEVSETRLQRYESRLQERDLEASTWAQRHTPQTDVRGSDSRLQETSLYGDRQPTAEKGLKALDVRLHGSELETSTCENRHATERGRHALESEKQQSLCEKRMQPTLATTHQPAACPPEPFVEARAWSADEASFTSSGNESEETEAGALCSPDLTEERGALSRVPHRKTRIAFSARQTSRLETAFRKQQYLSAQDRLKLAASLQISERQIKNWFQNRRSKLKRQAQDHPQSPVPPTTFVQPYSYHQRPFGTPEDVMAYHYGYQHPAFPPYSLNYGGQMNPALLQNSPHQLYGYGMNYYQQSAPQQLPFRQPPFQPQYQPPFDCPPLNLGLMSRDAQEQYPHALHHLAGTLKC
ncbi:uncharacterized protein LOC144753455 [Lissotriton helveticus]